ncbi:MAG: MerR family transcriptional regulator, partial [Eubacterium sp.]
MEKKELYLTGEFAKKANVSIRTIHFYEKKGLIHPLKIAENGYRYYGEQEFARLQRILTLKILGFSLGEIQALSLNETDADYLQQSLEQQRLLMQRKIQYLETVEKALEEVSEKLKREKKPNWNEITNLIRIANMDRELVEQYKNGTNINARIRLHHLYSQNPQSWFSWIFDQIEGEFFANVLELGCGTGQFWKENVQRIPADAHIHLTDISRGMLEDSRKNLNLDADEKRFSFDVADACAIPAEDDSFDMVIANFVLFYVKDQEKAFSEIRRVLKKD